MDVPSESPLLFFWNGDQNPTRLIETILPSLSEISKLPNYELKEKISTAISKCIGEKYPTFEFTSEFDAGGILQLKHRDHDLLCLLASGDRIVLWLSLLAVIRDVAPRNLRFVLYRPFSLLDSMKRIRMAEFLKDNFGDGQLILIGSKREFESI